MVTTRSQASSPAPATRRSAAANGTATPRKANGAANGEAHAGANGSAEPKLGSLNPKTTEFEFLGPPGAAFLLVLLPATVYGLYFLCDATGCPNPGVLRGDFSSVSKAFKAANLLDLQAFAAYIGWLAYMVALWFVLPGKWIEGIELRDGSRLKYKINAWPTFVVTMALIPAVVYLYGLGPLVWIADHYVGLATASVLYSFAQAAYLYASSFGEGRLLAVGGNSGNVFYDYWIGRELNPRIGDFDLKVFFELRPGLIGWLVLDFACAAKQYATLGYLTDSMWLVVLFQGYYVVDALWNEAAILTTMDVIMDGFGFMLTFGDLAWVPFTYSLQARYLMLYPKNLGYLATAAIVGVKLLGFAMFRGANNQKNAFRNDPNDPAVAHIKYIETEAGSRLMTSGWWGMARHINYLGDWLMGLAWCLPTGFDTPITYFYAIYFAVLLLHREGRDEHKCKHKYKKDWDRYCEIVPYRIIPGVY
ncbi:putative ERG24-C-14 sterol reductase [Hyaloraphidium curvatum]|nr:putative ERG24-C-14 sterol reductase [Hyaloraphidium curvatum]